MKKKHQTIEVNAAHINAALAQYLTIYYPSKLIDYVDADVDETVSVTIYYAESNVIPFKKKAKNAQEDSSVYDALPSDVEPIEGIGY